MPWNPAYEPVIGLEVHAQLKTVSKAFCGCSTRFGDNPNSNVCPVCLGMPGVLPVLNRQVVEFTLLMGLATHCSIRPRSSFARKNYFYPDLPKGYQISQFDEPICSKGWVEFEMHDGTRRRVGITRIHMEEDAGKSIHDLDIDSLVDLNRCGVPLIEIVSEPDLRTPAEASRYLQTIRQIVTYLGICDGNMEEGSLRCDANVSVRKVGAEEFGTKTEVKNMNSFRFVERAIEFEINRQIEVLESGGRVVQETMLWDSAQGVALPMRSKEEAHDYRYFPEPDLVPVVVDEPWIAGARSSLPEFPEVRRDRYVASFRLPKYDADILTAEKPLADYFELVVSGLSKQNDETVKLASNWTMTEVLRVVNEKRVALSELPVTPKRLASMINLIVNGTISGKIAKEVFEEMMAANEDPEVVVKRKGLVQISDTVAIELTIDEILAANPAEVEKYRAGKQQVFGFFVGEVMKRMKGKANPKMVNEVLKKKLER
ncbi:MAG: Asp-tRNA(Asn)/Glu-tRNA(Gln) amidotransferase subunit GatB [Bacteroidetes bacterium]|jgi:aspartyl-tRNA(Asn)/glutamyl-tRNA(Gln) amidotransferase subunit B|nr:Asp-tRNA(Asn)/Glu-tRNA(Gln) amidotransferase subunit GatB [Bacteroidota bacterium]